MNTKKKFAKILNAIIPASIDVTFGAIELFGDSWELMLAFLLRPWYEQSNNYLGFVLNGTLGTWFLREATVVKCMP